MAAQDSSKNDDAATKARDGEAASKADGDVSGRKHPASEKEGSAEVNTPGDGALPDPQPGGDVDPGVG